MTATVRAFEAAGYRFGVLSVFVFLFDCMVMSPLVGWVWDAHRRSSMSRRRQHEDNGLTDGLPIRKRADPVHEHV
jgi:hypothetical protein